MGDDTKSLYLTGKQIRVFIPTNIKDKLKSEAKGFGLTLEQYAGLRLRGIKLVQSEKSQE